MILQTSCLSSLLSLIFLSVCCTTHFSHFFFSFTYCFLCLSFLISVLLFLSLTQQAIQVSFVLSFNASSSSSLLLYSCLPFDARFVFDLDFLLFSLTNWFQCLQSVHFFLIVKQLWQLLLTLQERHKAIHSHIHFSHFAYKLIQHLFSCFYFSRKIWLNSRCFLGSRFDSYCFFLFLVHCLLLSTSLSTPDKFLSWSLWFYTLLNLVFFLFLLIFCNLFLHQFVSRILCSPNFETHFCQEVKE